jgi:hypothetical protein
MGDNTTNSQEQQFPTRPTTQTEITIKTQDKPTTNWRQQDQQYMDNFHIFQSPNKKNHKLIQKHKCKNSVQKHQHITTTCKTQAWQHNPRARQKRHLQTHISTHATCRTSDRRDAIWNNNTRSTSGI